MLHCGIVGLPLSGKSTVFNVITRAGAEVKPYAGGKTDPNKAVVAVPDNVLMLWLRYIRRAKRLLRR